MGTFEVVNIRPAVIDMDFGKVEETLTDKLTPYRGLVITGDTIGEAKISRKEVNDMRTEVEDFRKRYKKLLSQPIGAFEEKCKGLVAIIDETLAELDKGIAEVDNARRKVQRDNAETYRKEIADKYGLDPEQLEIKHEYTLLSATEKEVRADLESQAQIASLMAENARLKASETQYRVAYEITGTKSELQSVSEFLKAHGITYEVKSQEVV